MTPEQIIVWLEEWCENHGSYPEEGQYKVVDYGWMLNELRAHIKELS